MSPQFFTSESRGQPAPFCVTTLVRFTLPSCLPSGVHVSEHADHAVHSETLQYFLQGLSPMHCFVCLPSDLTHSVPPSLAEDAIALVRKIVPLLLLPAQVTEHGVQSPQAVQPHGFGQVTVHLLVSVSDSDSSLHLRSGLTERWRVLVPCPPSGQDTEHLFQRPHGDGVQSGGVHG